MTARQQSHTAPLSPEAALCVCADEFPKLGWSLRSDAKGRPRYCHGESDVFLFRVEWDGYTGWHVALTVRILRVGVGGVPFGVITTGGASLADTLHRLHQSLTTWVGTLVAEIGGEA